MIEVHLYLIINWAILYYHPAISSMMNGQRLGNQLCSCLQRGSHSLNPALQTGHIIWRFPRILPFGDTAVVLWATAEFAVLYSYELRRCGFQTYITPKILQILGGVGGTILGNTYYPELGRVEFSRELSHREPQLFRGLILKKKSSFNLCSLLIQIFRHSDITAYTS
jgi:hypothetical protein